MDAGDQVVSTYDLGRSSCAVLRPRADGHFALAGLLWDQTTNPKSLKVVRYDSRGAPGWTTPLDDTLAAPTDFGIGESRLGTARASTARTSTSTASRALPTVTGRCAALAGRDDGQSHPGLELGLLASMSELLRFSSAANQTLPICVTDCYPARPAPTSPPTRSAACTSILQWQGPRLRQGLQRQRRGGAGSAAPGMVGWKLVFNGHQNAAANGQNSYNSSTMNQDIGFVSVGNNGTPGSIVWLTTTVAMKPTPRSRASCHRAIPPSSTSSAGAPARPIAWPGLGAGAFLEGRSR